ncbi:ABC transporter substrate-binding protein [Bifidobacterium vespertilionis]|uniref:ABC transporter substrate-binding protein n=1 Tax=Bifidobacterium vespertilionis TaxID=2562524 RepID=A0A5J5DSC7_9BIFI|nr:ABC transporter substrate-binding protein [Bifidobacterium vespertilionis]KAA8816696.1 ABC transporter substrate-binding protein [Bifidobacterium vespertilionis]KAA8821780.1 ABC transporter substrate-binding protein [Bifidobacterium vespertilionis]
MTAIKDLWHTTWRKTAAAAIAAVCAVSLAGCGLNTSVGTAATAAGTSAQSTDTVRYALWSNPNGQFNPVTYFTDYDRAIIFNVYSRLVVLDAQQNYQPSLAKSYNWSADGKELTFELRDNVKWHDGEPFTAQDVVYTYAATANKDFPLDPSTLVQHLEGYEDYHAGKTQDFAGITAPDDHTVVFHFATPYSGALATFADKPVLAKHVWEKVPIAQWKTATDLLKHPIGTGPYKFKEFVDGQYVALEANPDYFEGAPATKNLIFKIVSPDTLQTAVINKEVDIAEISNFNSKELDAYKQQGVNIVEGEGNGGQYLTFDTKNPKLADKRVRQALLYAINRKGIIDSLLYGHGITFNAQAHPSDPLYPKDLNSYDYSPEKAKELLKEAGWTDTDGDGFLDKDGQKFTFTINFPTGNKTRELSAPIIQKNFQDIGIDAQLSQADFNTTLAILQDPNKQYDGVLMGGTFRPQQYGSANWWSRWGEDGESKAALDKVNETTDPTALAQAVSQYLHLENDEVPFAFLYIPNQGTAVRPEVKNFERSTYEIFSNVSKWSVSPSQAQ